MSVLSSLQPPDRALLDDARRAVLATTRADGRPRLVPITYATAADADRLTLYSSLDDKAKSVADPRRLARVRDILDRPHVSVLVDRWSEDWSALSWLRLDGVASLLEPGVDAAAERVHAIGLLRARYPQYARHRLEERPLIRIEIDSVSGWSAS